MTKLRVLRAWEVAARWDEVEGWLEWSREAWSHHWDMKQLRRHLLDGHFQVWYTVRDGETVPFAAGLSVLDQYGHMLVSRIWCVGGNGLSELMDALPQYEEWARALGCTHVEITGRRGWVRAARPHGYEPVRVVLAKEL